MVALKEDGFFKSEHLENTANVLMDKWKMTSEDRDMSILEVTGFNDNNKQKKYYMYDEHDGVNHSMARTTGLPVVAMVKLMAKGKFKAHGVHAPEMIAKKKKLAYDIIFFLKEHGITIDVEEYDTLV
jgi:saccharopine dehydrogenase-like NADP-dependent oxidoreductase